MTELDVSQINDLAPYIAVAAIVAGGFSAIAKFIEIWSLPSAERTRGVLWSKYIDATGMALLASVGIAALIAVLTV